MRALLMRSDWFCVLGQDDQVDGALGLFAGLSLDVSARFAARPARRAKSLSFNRRAALIICCGVIWGHLVLYGGLGYVLLILLVAGSSGIIARDRASLLSIRPVFADV
jgi:hypothetical protein